METRSRSGLDDRFLAVMKGFLPLGAALALSTCSDSQGPDSTPGPIQADHHGGVPLDDANGPVALRPASVSPVIHNGAIWTFPIIFQAGTGNLRPFLTLDNAGTVEECFNNDQDDVAEPTGLDCNGGHTRNERLPLNIVPVIKVGGEFYREFILDLNEPGSANSDQVSIDRFDVWLCNDANAPFYLLRSDFQENPNCHIIYDLDGYWGQGSAALSAGSGNRADYQVLIPDDNFILAGGEVDVDVGADCPYNPLAPDCGVYVVLHAHFGDQGGLEIAQSGFEEFSTVERGFVLVTKSANASFTRTFDWTIEKSVTPDEHDFFVGGPGANSDYSVTVTKGEGIDSDWSVSGEITIENPSDQDVSIASVEDVISDFGDVLVTCPDVTSFPHVLNAGATLTCTYGPVTFANGSTRTNTAYVTLADAATSQASADIVFDVPTALVYDEINVQDVFPFPDGEPTDLGPTNATTTFDTYARPFACTGEEAEATEGNYQYTRNNRATIVETEQSDDASVTVHCWRPTVTKTASTSLRRTYAWDIVKTARGDDGVYAPSVDIQLAQDQVYLQAYKVHVTNTGSVDDEWSVAGTITITNPAPIPLPAAAITLVSDQITPGWLPPEAPEPFDASASVVCPGGDVAASGGTKVCTWGPVAPGDALDRLNTATATVYGIAYSGTADIDFATASITHRDNCITVSDAGDLGDTDPLGTVCVENTPGAVAPYAPHTFEYFAPNNVVTEVCGDQTLNNTATGTTNTTSTLVQDNAEVNVTIDCVSGCTLTLGYWKTHNASFALAHNGHGPLPDPTWEDLGASKEQTGFFTYLGPAYPLQGPNVAPNNLNPSSLFSWFVVFWTAPQGNAYYQLARQYMAAELNRLNGATVPDPVANAMQFASGFFALYGPTNWPRPQRSGLITNAGILGNYNEGGAGVAHCTEDATSASQ